ncbi:MRS2-G [Scenedesmus sp. PABB004]|nr:MRS2-G [Scenedesmus sp. PABB004]
MAAPRSRLRLLLAGLTRAQASPAHVAWTSCVAAPHAIPAAAAAAAAAPRAAPGNAAPRPAAGQARRWPVQRWRLLGHCLGPHGPASRGFASSAAAAQQQREGWGPVLHGVHPAGEPPDDAVRARLAALGGSPPGGEAHAGGDGGGDEAEHGDGGRGDAHQHHGDDGAAEQHGGVRLRFRQKTPLFQARRRPCCAGARRPGAAPARPPTLRPRPHARAAGAQVIEFHAGGQAVEEYRPRTPQELGLHPRDVTLFAPISRLAAPQRATIAVHDGKILVKTEIVKAIITADRAILIKGRRQRDTQKLAQAILAANDQRLRAVRIARHQAEQTANPIGPGAAMGSCERAASAADLLRAVSAKARSSARLTAGGAGVGYVQTSGGGGLGGDAAPWAAGRARGGAGDAVQPAAVAAGADALSRAAGGGGGGGPSSASSGDLKDCPFELLVLEVLLDATAEYFYTKVQHLNWMLESVAADMRATSAAGATGALDKAHQLIPIQKFLTRVKNDVKETAEAISTVLEDDETLGELCLSWHVAARQHSTWVPVELQRHRAARMASAGGSGGAGYHTSASGWQAGPPESGAAAVGPAAQVRALTEMLESYEREIQSLEGSVNEAEEDLENTRSQYHMQLDSSRNHIIMVNLWLSMLNISVMATTILPAFFGMNLGSGLSDADPVNFYAVCGGSLALAALSYPACRSWYDRNWRRVNQNEQFEQKMLRVLLVQNIEDVDDIIRALQQHRHERLDRKRFRSIVLETLGGRAMTPAHIDFLYACFDRNRDGFIEEAEVIRPLNTYHAQANGGGGGGGGDGGGSDFGGGSSVFSYGPAPEWGVAPAALGALGAGARLPGGDGGGPAGLGQAVRASPPRQQQQQQRPEKQDSKGDSWTDDDRFSWD